MTAPDIGFERPAATLSDRYQQAKNTPSDIWLHLPRLVDMVLERDAKHVIELGTRSGVSTIAWLYALAQTDGRLTSVDIDPKPPIGDWPHWRFIQGDDMAVSTYLTLDEADIVFVDTSHHFDHTLRELYLYQHLVRRPGLIVCHDTELARPEGSPRTDPSYPVRTAIELFTEEERFEWVNHPECWGLGVITLP